jgi:hypothetical protein
MADELSTARSHMVAALEILDQLRAPPEIGALVDLAMCRLDSLVEENWIRPGAVTVPPPRKNT